MRELAVLMLIAVALAWCADHVTVGPVNPNRRHRMIVCTLVIIILLAGFAGLRTHCNDTGAYRHGYELINERSWEASDKSVGSNPLFNWVNYQLKMRGVSTQNFLMFWAFLTVGCYIAFVHRYSANYSLTIFLLFTTGCYTFAFAGIKQAAAVGIAVIAVMFALRKKWLLFLAGVAVATLIHPYALMYLLVPFMEFRPWTKKTYWMLAASAAGYGGQYYHAAGRGIHCHVIRRRGREYFPCSRLQCAAGAVLYLPQETVCGQFNGREPYDKSDHA